MKTLIAAELDGPTACTCDGVPYLRRREAPAFMRPALFNIKHKHHHDHDDHDDDDDDDDEEEEDDDDDDQDHDYD